MNKKDFYRLIFAEDTLEDYIMDYWIDLREEQKLPWDWGESFDYECDISKKTITIETQFGKNEYPMEDFFSKPEVEEPQMLWHLGYYDGPMSGIAKYNGKLAWFDMEDDTYDNIFRMRTYKLYELTEAQAKREIRIHNRWRKQVGRHCDYSDEYWDPEDKDVKGLKVIHHLFYEWKEKFRASFKKEKYSNGKYLGTFDQSQFIRGKERTLGVNKEEID